MKATKRSRYAPMESQEVVMEDSQVAAALPAQLAERIGQQKFDLWFTQQANIDVRGTVLTIRASSSFVRDWMRSHFSQEIRTIWESIVGVAGTVEFELQSRNQDSVQSSLQRVPEPTRAGRPTKSMASPPAPVRSVTASATLTDPAGPRRNASLSGLVVGPSNEYAMRSAELTARGRQQASPLLFVGPTGVGKTHLLRGIQQEYRRHHPGAIALYLTAEQFTTNFVEALRGSGIPSFRQKVRGAQLLAIDDLQFFPGKRRTVEELLYTIDTLSANGRQIVLASDRAPAQLHALGPELISRLIGGLTCEMVSPGFATRVEIVRRLADEAGIALEDDVAVLVATQISTGARELGGALHRLRAMSAAYNEPITKALAERGLAELARHNTRAVRLADVQKVVCEAFGVEPVQLRSDRKARGLAEPRMLAMWLARKYTRAPWSEIGEFFGRNSHSTVISAHRRVEKLIAAEAQIGMADQSCQVDEAIRRLESALRTA